MRAGRAVRRGWDVTLDVEEGRDGDTVWDMGKAGEGKVDGAGDGDVDEAR